MSKGSFILPANPNEFCQIRPPSCQSPAKFDVNLEKAEKCVICATETLR